MPFIVLSDSMEYYTQFEHCRNDQAHRETAAILVNSKKAPASSSTQTMLGSSHFSPYDKSALHSFQTTLCIHCGISGLKASDCTAMGSNAVNQPIIINC